MLLNSACHCSRIAPPAQGQIQKTAYVTAFFAPGRGGRWLISKVSQVYLEAVAELLTVQVSFRVSKHICGVTLDEIVCLSARVPVGPAPPPMFMVSCRSVSWAGSL